MPSPRFITSSHSLPRPPSPSPSQRTVQSPSDDGAPPPPTPPPTSQRRLSARLSRFLHFFQPSRRRRGNVGHASPHQTDADSTVASRVAVGVHVRPDPTSAASSRGVASPSGIEMRRGRRGYRQRNSQPRQRQRSRRTMSDGILHHTASDASSVSVGAQEVSSPSQPVSITASRTGRSPFTLSGSGMRFRRTGTTGGGIGSSTAASPGSGDAASTTTSMAGVGSTASVLSDSDESNAHDDIVHGGVSTVDGRDARSSTLMPSGIADFDAMHDHDLFAVMNRLWEDYTGPPTDVFQSPVFVRRMPVHARQRLAMRVHNAYYISGRRQGRAYNGGNGDVAVRIGVPGMPGMHHHHHHHHHHLGHGATLHGQNGLPAGLPGGMHVSLGLEDREVRLNLHTVRIQEGGHDPYDSAASDAQIEALPSFVMDKGETRSVREIFDSLRNSHNDVDTANGSNRADNGSENEILKSKATVGSTCDDAKCDDDDDNGGDGDECGGLMTSFTECAICLSDFEPGDEITALPCGHFFHLTGCVREWLSKHARTCPTCRADISVDKHSNNSSVSSGTLRSSSGPIRMLATPAVSSSPSGSEEII